MSKFKKAVRTQRDLRMAIYGPSNSGKTFTALMIARELVGPDGTIALIDTERSSASIYAKDGDTGNGFDFDAAPLAAYGHTDYIALIEQAKDYDLLIVDSLSHAWEGKGGILDIHSSVVEKQKGTKDSFGAWRSPKIRTAEESLWAAVLDFPGHIIVTMRAKTAYEISKDERGRAKIEKLGLKPNQRSGLEFEFDVIAEMDKEHWLEIDKARDPEGKLEGQRIHKPGVKFAKTLKTWLDSGSSPAEDYEARIGLTCEEIAKLMGEDINDIKQKAWDWIKLQYETRNLSDISNEELAKIPERLIDNFGPGNLEEQRQSRMADREEEAQTEDNPESREELFSDINASVDQYDLDKKYVWAEMRRRAKGAQPTNEELGHQAKHIAEHPELWTEDVSDRVEA